MELEEVELEWNLIFEIEEKVEIEKVVAFEMLELMLMSLDSVANSFRWNREEGLERTKVGD